MFKPLRRHVALASLLALPIAAGVLTPTTAVAAPTALRQLQVGSFTTNFNLMLPDAAVTFTVGGTVVGHGATDANGDVSFTYTPSGLSAGTYRLVATAEGGVSSSVAFGVR